MTVEHNMSKPLVSVVIPVHNREHQLLDAVASVKAQEVEAEIVLVDDASTDGSAHVISELSASDSLITVRLLAQNMGGGYARNVGIEASRGEWIAFLDSDDVWLPGKLKAQLDFIQLHHPSDEEVLCFSNLLLDANSGLEPKPWITEPFQSSDSAKEYLLERNQVIQTSTVVISASAAKRIRFDPTLRRHQDIDFVIRCELDGVKFVYLDAPLVRYAADPTAVRVSGRRNAKPSLHWLDGPGLAYLSQLERDQFYLRHVFDIHFREAPFSAVLRGAGAVRRQADSAGAFSMCVAKQLIPASVKKFRNALRST